MFGVATRKGYHYHKGPNKNSSSGDDPSKNQTPILINKADRGGGGSGGGGGADDKSGKKEKGNKNDKNDKKEKVNKDSKEGGEVGKEEEQNKINELVSCVANMKSSLDILINQSKSGQICSSSQSQPLIPPQFFAVFDTNSNPINVDYASSYIKLVDKQFTLQIIFKSAPPTTGFIIVANTPDSNHTVRLIIQLICSISNDVTENFLLDGQLGFTANMCQIIVPGTPNLKSALLSITFQGAVF